MKDERPLLAHWLEQRQGRHGLEVAMWCRMLAVAVIVLGCAGGAWAQGTEQVQFCVSIKEVGCSTAGDCAVPTPECAMRLFTAPSGGLYRTSLQVVCDDGVRCAHCQACLNVVRVSDGQLIHNCHNNCMAGDCDEACGDAGSLCPLEAGVQYKLYLCLRPCPNSDCNGCNANCHAKGFVLLEGSPCVKP